MSVIEQQETLQVCLQTRLVTIPSKEYTDSDKLQEAIRRGYKAEKQQKIWKHLLKYE